MIVLLSPAKKMRVLSGIKGTRPLFEHETLSIAQLIRRKSIGELSERMHISDRLAEQVHQVYNEFPRNPTPAPFAYAGTPFSRIAPEALSHGQLEFAQKHMYIISGLFGPLRPLELESYTSLYTFWKPKIIEVLEKLPDEQFINLASSEYSKVVDFTRLGKVISVTFKTDGPNGPRTIGMHAKWARGDMVSQILREGIDDSEELSSPNEWVFLH
jgi:hypothetical protein